MGQVFVVYSKNSKACDVLEGKIRANLKQLFEIKHNLYFK